MEDCSHSLDSPEDFQQEEEEEAIEDAMLDPAEDAAMLVPVDNDDDDEDEVEELRNSLRAVVMDPSIRPSVQCLLVDPSFSMVTVQSEDSGIVWETASSPSRCSTPGSLASCSLLSEGCSATGGPLGGGDTAGRITIIFDQDKVVRRRTRSGARSISSRLSDRYRRASGGSASRCGSSLGVERLEMAEVSLPNVPATRGGGGDGTAEEAEPPDKDQQLFSLISDGYEILNIRVPSKLPTVDEEESSDLPENLAYLEKTPGIRSRTAPTQSHSAPSGQEEVEPPPDQEVQPSLQPCSTLTDSGGDVMDYMEKFSLLDEVEVVRPAQTQEEEEEDQLSAQAKVRPKVARERSMEVPDSAAESPAVSSDDSFVFVTDMDPPGDPLEEEDQLAGDHLDEVFYGSSNVVDEERTRHTLQQQDSEEEMEEARRRSRRESQRSAKSCSGSQLFGDAEDTVLTPIYLPEGPPKVIDQILLDEPPAMSFMYSDLYEEAMGERTRSEEHLEAQCVTPEHGLRRRSLSEEEESDGSYLEMFTLRDDLPAMMDKPPDAQEEKRANNSMMWPQSAFEMSGCLQRVQEEEEELEQKAETKEKEEEEVDSVPLTAASEESTEEQEVEREAENIEDASDVTVDVTTNAVGVTTHETEVDEERGETEERHRTAQEEEGEEEEEEEEVTGVEGQPQTRTEEGKDETCTEEETTAAEASPASAEEPSQQATPVKPDEGLKDEEETAPDVEEDAREETDYVREALSEEAAPETQPVAAGEDNVTEKLSESMTEVEVVLTQEAITTQEAIRTEDSIEGQTSTEATPVDGEAESLHMSVEVVTDSSQPVEVITDSSEPVEVITDSSEPVEVITDSSEPVEVITDSSEPVEVITDSSQPVEVITDSSEPVEVITDGGEPAIGAVVFLPGPGSDAEPGPVVPEEVKAGPVVPEDVKAADVDVETPSLAPKSTTDKNGEGTEPAAAEAAEAKAPPPPGGDEEESDRTPGPQQIIQEEAEDVEPSETEERKVEKKEDVENKEKEEDEATNAEQKTLLTTDEGSEGTQVAAGPPGGAKTSPEGTQEATDQASPEGARPASEVLSEEEATATEPQTERPVMETQPEPERPIAERPIMETQPEPEAVNQPEAVTVNRVIVVGTEEPEADTTETSTETPTRVHEETEETAVVAERLPPPVVVVTDLCEPVEVVPDLREPVEVVTEGSEPVEMITEGSEPVEMITEGSEPVEMITEGSEPVEMITEGSEPVEMITEGSEPVEMITEGSEPVEMITEGSEPVVDLCEPVVVVTEGSEPVEVFTHGCDPAIRAVVEVTEGSADPTQLQTQVQVALREAVFMTAEEEERTPAEPEPEPEAGSDDVGDRFPDAESEALLPEMVVVMAGVDETPSTDKRAADREVVLPTETVSVGNEIIVLVPKGTAVEMDIEVRRSSDVPVPKETAAELDVELGGQGSDVLVPKGTAAELDVELGGQGSDVLVPKGTAVEIDVEVGQSPDTPAARPEEPRDPAPLHTVLPSPPPRRHRLTATSSTTEPRPHVEEPPPEEESGDSVAEMATEVVERWPSPPPAPSAEEEEEEEREEEEEEEEEEEAQGALLPLRSFSAQEDLSALISEPSGTEEREGGATDVPPHADTDHRDDARPETTPTLPSPWAEDADATAERVVKDDVAAGLEDVLELQAEDQSPESELQRAAEVSGQEEVETETRRVAEEMDGEEVSEQEEVDVAEEMESRQADMSPRIEVHTEDDCPETELPVGDLGPWTELREGDLGPGTELREGGLGPEMEIHQRDISEAPQVVSEEPGYEIISQQEVKETESTAAGAELRRFTAADQGGPITEEEDYDIIDAEEESQAREAAALSGMDWFCLDCGCLLLTQERQSGPHMEHQVTDVETAYQDIKERLGEWISELQERSENIEDLVSELEMSYNTVEDQCTESESSILHQNEEMMAVVMDQYTSMSLSMEQEKKAKLEQLYDQIVCFQESIDSAKMTLETAGREAETEARSIEDIETSLSAALASALALELGPRGLLVFQDLTKRSSAAPSHSLSVPQKPRLSEQEAGSASGTSVTVYWRVEPGDVIDCFQVYCMEHPQGAVSEEYRVTVKESFCVLEELEPEKTYKVWVMGVNQSGCSLPSDRTMFRTAPSVPVIHPERCSVRGDWATLRWTSTSSTEPRGGASYTLEYCRQLELEGEGLRSISGIRSTEQEVLLQPDEKYLFYIKAVNQSGASEQSEAALISTKSSRFHLLPTSCHPALSLSDDLSTVQLRQDSTHTQCASVLGECLPARGCHYWETSVTGSPAYRVGVAYETANRDSPLGEDSASWCLHCIATPSSCSMELRHGGSVCVSSSVGEVPQRLGVLLDYNGLHYPQCTLSFYNAHTGQRLASVRQNFTRPLHPALGLDRTGTLGLLMVTERPHFTNTS